MRRLLTTCAVLALAACATHPAPPTTAATGSQSPAQPCTAMNARTDAPCTGTGRTYSQQDIQRTGQQNVGPALQMLDPSITVH